MAKLSDSQRRTKMTEWIKHDGKSVPLPKLTKVLVRFRDGFDEEIRGYKPMYVSYWENECDWSSSNWCHNDGNPCDADIMEYKVVESCESEQSNL